MTDAALQAAVKAMHTGDNLFDVTIICTTDDHQADYWMEKLASGICSHKSNATYPLVLAVSEDWGGSGAGNGLGTLYAFQKAAALAKAKHGIDLMAELASGNISAALFHTAGKGTRMAPLPASENNNKPGVKLPFCLKVPNGSYQQPLTVLEAVVKQTGIYAKSRKGRLSVFWGDQVFLPTAPFDVASTHHIDILCTLLGDTAPTAEEWQQQGLDKYGVIACIESENGRLDAAQVEKVSHATAVQMLASLGQIRQVGPSLGSFSVSAAMLQALSDEFSMELAEKTAKLDTDPHFWMPLTLSVDDYVTLMKQKGTEEAEAREHHARMQAMKASFDMGDLGLFGAVDVGKDACWWDYGQLKLYSQNCRLLLEQSKSADLLRSFLGLETHQVDSKLDDVKVDSASYAFGSKAKSGSITESLLAQVSTPEINADGAIIVNCVAKKITAGKGAILYNLMNDSEEGIVAEPGQVMVAVTDEAGDSMLLQSRMDIDGGKAWKIKLDMNEMSFEDVHKKNKNANIQDIHKKRRENYKKVEAKFPWTL